MNVVLQRWKVVVDFVQGHDVSDVSLWGENLTARMDGQIFSLAEAKTLRTITNQRLLRKRGGGRLAVREVCMHAPNIEAVILRGNEHELTGYMLTGREAGMIDFLSALKAVQHLVEPSDYQHYSKQ